MTGGAHPTQAHPWHRSQGSARRHRRSILLRSAPGTAHRALQGNGATGSANGAVPGANGGPAEAYPREALSPLPDWRLNLHCSCGCNVRCAWWLRRLPSCTPTILCLYLAAIVQASLSGMFKEVVEEVPPRRAEGLSGPAVP